jgi:hypothetical protein
MYGPFDFTGHPIQRQGRFYSPGEHQDDLDEEQQRKLQAKRFNEHVKLLVTSLNAIGLVIFGAGVLQPLVTAGPGSLSFLNLVWIALGVALHLCAQALIRLIRPE